MDNVFYSNIVELLKSSDIDFRDTTIRPARYTDDGRWEVTITGCDRMFNSCTSLNNKPSITCLIVFSLFDSYIENVYQMDTGMSFKRKYRQIPHNTNKDIIIKECYRLIKTIRNGFVHNLNEINAEDNIYHFNYISPRGTVFNLDISKNILDLLYSIILLIVQNKYVIHTEGHYENVLCTYYSELKNYIDLEGNFRDDGNMGEGSEESFFIEPISEYLPLKTFLRYPISNTCYEINEGELKINSIYDPGIDSYSADYFIEYNGEKYMIPQEIVTNNSIPLTALAVWRIIG